MGWSHLYPFPYSSIQQAAKTSLSSLDPKEIIRYLVPLLLWGFVVVVVVVLFYFGFVAVITVI